MTYYPNAQLQITDLAFARHYRWLFRAVNAKLMAGTTWQIMGVNGAGKSTLLRVLAGFIEPSAGTIQWDAQATGGKNAVFTQSVHYLGHQNGLKPTLSIWENWRLAMALTGRAFNQKAAQAVLQDLQLLGYEHQLVSSLSAGQQRRVALARLVLIPCQLWLLDEPITALDAQGQSWWLDCLRAHSAQGGISVIATHQTLALDHDVQLLVLQANLTPPIER